MRNLSIIIIALLLCLNAKSQGVGINPYGSAPGSNAMLDVASTNKGVVIPRMSTAQRNAIPVTGNDIGLMVFDYEKQRVYMYDGLRWLPMAVEKLGGFILRNVEPTAVSEKAGLGVSVDIDGEFAVVGAYLDSVGANHSQGSAHVYRNIAGIWTKVAELIASDGDLIDNFGCSVAIDGNNIVVGAEKAGPGTNQSGAAYVFSRINGVWTQQAKLVDPTPYDGAYFGNDVDIEGSTIIVGSPNSIINGDLSRGSIFVYNKVGVAWVLNVELTDNTGMAGYQLGASVSLSGNYIAAGEPGHYVVSNGNAYDVGAVCIYFKNGGVWGQQTKIVNPLLGNAWFGRNLDLNQDKLLVTTGSGTFAKIYTRSGTVWSEFQHIFSVGNAFGRSPKLQSNFMLIGASNETVDNMLSAGAVMVFKKNSAGKYILYKRLTDPEALYGGFFGSAIGFDGVNFVVGSPGANDEKGKVSFGSVTE